MTTYKHLKLAADALDSMADALEAGMKKVAAAQKAADEAQKKLASVKTAAAKPAGPSAAIGKLAKEASASLLQSGLISNQNQADIFAAEITNHEKALQKLAQLGKVTKAPRVGNVVKQASSAEPSANEVFERALAQALSAGR